jgi:polyisoprenoid-binding protein YceI
LRLQRSFGALVLLAISTGAAAQESVLAFDASHTTINFTLDAALHTVHGTFQLKRGLVRFNPATGKVSGEIAVDGTSGESGSSMRDRKMHREVLESEQYPEITFRPDRVNGAVAPQGKSSVKIHGMFNIHGVDREIEVPAAVEMAADHWSAAVHFTIPYAKWGMKNPSNFFLHVSDSVEIDLSAAGKLTRGTSSGSAQ